MKLSDLIDFNPRRVIEKGAVAPFIEMADLPEGEREISQVGSRVFSGGGSRFANGDTLFARITPCLENGKTAKVSGLPNELIAHGSTEFIVMSAKDKEHDEDFIYYLARYPEFRAFAKGRMEGTSGRQRVSWQALSDYEILNFNENERKQIGSILASIDNRIAANRKINKTIEKMVMALFNDWFIDFGPVKENINGKQARRMAKELAQLFPNGIGDDEIPRGWTRCNFGALLESSIGGDWGKDVLDTEHTESVSIIRGTDIPNVHNGSCDRVPSRFTTSNKLKKRVLQNGDILIEVSGGSPTQPTGRALLLRSSALSMFENPVVPASFCRRFRPHDKKYSNLLICHLNKLYEDGGTWFYQNQSTGIANFQTTYFLEAEKVLLPSDAILLEFNKIVDPLFSQIDSNNTENRILRKARLQLIPKLFSGEFRINDAGKLAQHSEVGA